MPYRPELDGLRGVAVLLVVLFHLREGWLPGGFVGVDAFFVLSGYLITGGIRTRLDAGTFRFHDFFQRRIARLGPVFFAVLLAVLMTAPAVYEAQDLAGVASAAAAAAFGVANLHAAGESGYFHVAADARPLLHFWSLAVEEQFYLVFPVFLVLLAWFRGGRWTTVGLAACASASLLNCVISTSSYPESAFFLLPSRAWELLAGGLLAWSGRESCSPHRWERNGLIAGLGLALLLCSAAFLDPTVPFPGVAAIAPVLGTLLVIGRGRGSSHVVERLLRFRPLGSLGRASYSLYLWHWPVFCMVDYALHERSDPFRLSSKLGITAALTVVSYLLLERPLRAFLNGRCTPRLAFAGLAVTATAVAFTGWHAGHAFHPQPHLIDVAGGGVRVGSAGAARTIVIIGDSEAAALGPAFARIAGSPTAPDARYYLLGVPAQDPLPGSALHAATMEFLGGLDPDPEAVIVAVAWASRLGNREETLRAMLEELLSLAPRVVLVERPPSLPSGLSRASVRSGAATVQPEDANARRDRLAVGRLLRRLASDRVQVVPCPTGFFDSAGRVRFHGDSGRQLYHDPWHVSAAGADLIARDVLKALASP